ncbi:MAG TPA: protoporphyrinogen oxidase [Opitutaceae bacterium]|nr:protoporphyrinogen oxidase [Opitutaceae bacterium]
MAEPAQKSIAIVGGGVTGLTTAWRLHARGFRVTVFETADRFGGAVTTSARDGWLIECGPNSLLESPEFDRLVADLGLSGERIYAGPAAKNRYLMRGGRLLPVPMAPHRLLATPLFSLRTKLRLITEPFARARVRPADVSLATLVRDHFGQEIVDYAINPLVAGIYAGDPEKLSARHAFAKLWEIEQRHGSLIRGQIAAMRERRARGEAPASRIVSFTRGLETLPAALAARLPPGAIRTGTAVLSLSAGTPWKVVSRHGGLAATDEFDAVVLALPAAALARLPVGPAEDRPLAALDGVAYPPVTSLFLGFRREQVAHPLDGFGGLVPEIEHRSILGVLFSSTLFPGRAPDGHVALTVYVGGTRQPDLGRLPPEALRPRVLADLRDLLGLRGDPVFAHATSWPHAIPQYNLGYERFLDAMTRAETRHAGLFIGGHVRDGISVANCIAAGQRLANAAAAYLAR